MHFISIIIMILHIQIQLDTKKIHSKLLRKDIFWNEVFWR